MTSQIIHLHRSLLCAALVCLLAPLLPLNAADWKVEEARHPDQPGQVLNLTRNGHTLAQFVYGEGQMKPYLHVYGPNKTRLTKGGPENPFPHHRGIFIGWKISSDLGTYDLWHMGNGGKMEVLEITDRATGPDFASFTATIAWRAPKTDDSGSNLLLTEQRAIKLRYDEPASQAIIDAHFHLEPHRPLTLGGDLQHAGIHLRAAREVSERRNETSYLMEPAGKVKGDDLKWVQLKFPIGDQWFAAQEINHPKNPVEELSTRNYGRFGYFFKKKLEPGDPLSLHYRFVVGPVAEESSPDDLMSKARQQYQSFLNECVP